MTLRSQGRIFWIDGLGIRKALGFAQRNKVLRGELSPSQRPENRRWQCTVWRDDGSLAILVPRSVRGRLLASVPHNPVRCASGVWRYRPCERMQCLRATWSLCIWSVSFRSWAIRSTTILRHEDHRPPELRDELREHEYVQTVRTIACPHLRAIEPHAKPRPAKKVPTCRPKVAFVVLLSIPSFAAKCRHSTTARVPSNLCAERYLYQ